jgi:hypothetical protein
VQTKDGYLLGLHRLAWRKGEEDTKVNRGIKSVKKRVVYLHHGLLMNSEVWVCLTDEQRALPFVLVEKGFDVWVGAYLGQEDMANRMLTTAVWEQPRQQVLQKVHLLVAKLAQVLELLHRRIRLP